MSFRSRAIAVANHLAALGGRGNPVGRKYGGAGCAIMLHSVVRCSKENLFQDIRFPQAALERVLAYCRRENIDIVDIDEALLRLRNDGGRPFVVFTFDDGYADNLELCLPLFERYDAKMTVFVTTDMIERSIYYWWGGLLHLCRKQDAVEVEALDARFPTRTIREKVEVLRRLTRWVQADVAGRGARLRPTFAKYRTPLADLVDEDALSTAQLRTLAASPLVTIGGHTVTHRPLASLDSRTALAEVVDNRRFLEERTGLEVAHFAYPHGDAAACSLRDAALVRSAGFRSAFSTRKGNLFPAHGAAPFLLPRGTLNPRRASLVHFRAQLNGVDRCMASRAGPAVDPALIVVGKQSAPAMQ